MAEIADISLWKNLSRKSNEENDKTKSLIFPANNKIVNFSKDVVRLLNLADNNKPVYAIDFPEEKALSLFAAMFLKPDQYSSIQSAFIIPAIENTVFFESDNDNFAPIFGNFNFRAMYPKEILGACFANAHIGSLLLKPYNICRFIQKPFKNDAVEVLDIDYSQKKALIRLWAVTEPPQFSILRQKKLPIDEDTLLDSKGSCVKKRVYLNFAKTKYSDNGYVFRDQKFVDSFLIMKVDISQLIVFDDANITLEERERFETPPNATSKNLISRIKYANTLIRDLSQVPVQSLKPIPIEPIDAMEVYATLHLPTPKVKIDSASSSNSKLLLYQLVQQPTGENGIVIGFNEVEINILLTTNDKINVPLNTQLTKVTSDNLARDSNNRRLFVGDVVRINAGELSGSRATIIASIKKDLFVRAITDSGESNKAFVKSSDTTQIMDDEGPVLIPQ
jgi:hypothetical protein